MIPRSTLRFSFACALALGVVCGCSSNTDPCANGVQDPGEGDVDCGGTCAPCVIGRNCVQDDDCASAHCGAAHRCVECVAPDTCPGTDGVCARRTCTAGACGMELTAAGTPTASQTAGDCREVRCDGSGATTTANDDTDLPDDGNVCTQDVCTAGVASNPPEAAGTSCGTDLVCDGAGACSGCATADDCPGTDGECGTRTCDAGVCGTAYADAGTPLADQTAGDCHQVQCDGSGGTTDAVDDTDLPDDGNPCTADVCTSGTASHADVDEGTSCGTDLICDGAGACVGCVTAGDCPGTDDECGSRTCDAGVCGMDYADAGTPVTAQEPGDCHQVQCDGSGGTTDEVDDTDLPDDGNDCTTDLCTGGTASHEDVDAGTACTGGMCDGSGACVECLVAADCGEDTECSSWSCAGDHTCSESFADEGTATATQAPGDCLQTQCDGTGGTTDVIDDTDLPVDDNPCTDDICTAGVASHDFVTSGTVCGTDLICDDAGHCVGCRDENDCPGTDTDCGWRTCTGGTCGMAYADAGTATSDQLTGDCHENQCDGVGAESSVVDDTDVPVDDGNDCTAEVCDAGVGSHPFLDAGDACGSGGGTMCDGAGLCVECLLPTDCPGTDNECGTRTCTAGVCGLDVEDAGTATPTQSPGDCHENRCDGAGNVDDVVDDTDVPVDGLQCTADVCTAGVASNPPVDDGTACTDGGGGYCRAGACAPATIVVLRAGDGSGTLTTGSTAAFLEPYDLAGAALHAPVPLPTAVSGANQPLTIAGSSTSEGGLTLSQDGRYLVLAGYAVAPGVATIASTATSTNHRVVGRIDAAWDIDTSTVFTAAFSGSNIRGAASVDGSVFWASGNSSGSSGGVWSIPLGTTTATHVLLDPNNMHFVAVLGGQLYGSASTGTFTNVFTIGSGLPTTAGQTATSLNGMPTSGGSPYAFVLFDRNAAVDGPDTLYVADDSAGLQKWTFDGATWTLAATFGTSNVRGLAGMVTGANVTLVASTTGTSANSLLVFVDTGSGSPTPTTIKTAGTNTVFRGVAFSPR